MNSHRLSCDNVVAEFVIERYVADKLSESETVAFEEHLLLCDRCQGEITLAVAVREALPSAGGTEGARAAKIWPWKPMGIGISLAAAAAIAAILMLPIGRESSPIAELGQVIQPPIYLGVPVRQVPARPDSVFNAAMASYGEGDYAAAVRQLETAIAAGVDGPPAQFFLGASLLMLDNPGEAVAAFEAVTSSWDPTYTPEAHYYMAKALLRQGKTDAALAELRAVSDTVGEISAQARSLADSVESIAE